MKTKFTRGDKVRTKHGHVGTVTKVLDDLRIVVNGDYLGWFHPSNIRSV